MKLGELLNAIPELAPVSDSAVLDQDIQAISTNSHACSPQSLFIGMPGTRVDGGEFWPRAFESGAIAALVSPSALAKFPAQPGQGVIAVKDLVTACAQVAAAFYGYPSQQLTLIGIT
ncbi:MAG: Mur ligase domain-containing protein, partial [Microcystaceae cyanobacterium]